MKKKLGIILLCSFGIITACAPKNQVSDTMVQTEAVKESSKAENVKSETTKPETPETQISKGEAENETMAEEKAFDTYEAFSKLLGTSDEAVKDSYGGGKENKTEDGTILIGREYQTFFKGEPINMSTMYDDAEKVMLVQVFLPSKDSENYKDELSLELNTEPEVPAKGESGGSATNWNKDGIQYTLHKSAGETILEIIALQN